MEMGNPGMYKLPHIRWHPGIAVEVEVQALPGMVVVGVMVVTMAQPEAGADRA